MNALQIYRSLVEKLAASGDDRAQTLLELGKAAEAQESLFDAYSLSLDLKNASEYLDRALVRNGTSWSCETDELIKSAKSSLGNAQVRLATRSA